jgi:hypothetical protein
LVFKDWRLESRPNPQAGMPALHCARWLPVPVRRDGDPTTDSTGAGRVEETLRLNWRSRAKQFAAFFNVELHLRHESLFSVLFSVNRAFDTAVAAFRKNAANPA